MKGDFSRNTYNQNNHYIGVRWQQGRPTTDADKNEEQDILIGRIELADRDTIGLTGGPKVAPGFGLSIDSNGHLNISEGHYYVGGILVENDAAVKYESQPHWPDIPSLESALGNAEFGLVFMEVFKRHLTYRDRPDIRDKALNGLDTTTRIETVWRIHVLPLTSIVLDDSNRKKLTDLTHEISELDQELAKNTDPQKRADILRRRKKSQRNLEKVLENIGLSCRTSFPEYEEAIKIPTGTLAITTQPGGTEDSPCNVPELGGYTRGENQYYIVQVHSVSDDGSRNEATFKFSRDNGSIVALISSVGTTKSGTAAGTVFYVDSVQHDDYLGIHVDDWIEYVDDKHELTGSPGTLARVTEADVNLNRITVDSPINVNLDRHPKFRKWDQVGELASDKGVKMNTTASPVEIEGGIRLLFSDGSYRPGDYWQFAARAIDASIDFPAGAQPPMGVKRHYAQLGIILMAERTAGVRKPELLMDCRELFPPLTDISAEDVSFNNFACQLPDVTTVQDAIEALCSRMPCSTFVVSPGPDWFKVFELIPEGFSAEICFRLGEYPLNSSVVIRHKGNLKITGAGPGTRIIAESSENALTFTSRTVIIEDLYVQTGVAGSGSSDNFGLRGALSFESCGSVTLNRVILRCAADVVRSSACLRVSSDPQFTRSGVVDVQNCLFQVGSNQIGALVVNCAKALFHNNIMQCEDSRKSAQYISPHNLKNNPELRAEVRRTLLSDIQEGRSADANRFTLNISKVTVNFRFDPELEKISFFDELLIKFPPGVINSAIAAKEYLQDAVDSALINPEGLAKFAGYFQQLMSADHDLPTLYQGITIGGKEAKEVRIINNTIMDALQGIHIGQSRSNQLRDERLKSLIVNIEGNTVYSRISPAINREAYGIYIGNCDSLMVHNNTLRREDITSTKHLRMDGVHVNGELGKKAIFRHNDVCNYFTGIYVKPESDVVSPLWMVADNVATVETTDKRVVVSNNIPCETTAIV